MTQQSPPASRPRIAPLGLLFLALTSIGWGLTWPAMKLLLTEWPPLSARGGPGVVGAILLAGLALARSRNPDAPVRNHGRLRSPQMPDADPAFVEHRAMAIYAAVEGAQLVARGRGDIAVFDRTINAYRAAGLLLP